MEMGAEAASVNLFLCSFARESSMSSLVEKENIVSHIKSKTENGKVAVVWSGVDADCVSWGNRVDVVSSSYVQIEKMLNDTYEGSEGSIDFYYEKPSIAEKLTETSRDLAMEAFEEGHPHVVYR